MTLYLPVNINSKYKFYFHMRVLFFVIHKLACEKSIVDGTEWPAPRWYGPAHVLIDSCDDPSDVHYQASIDWWAAPEGARGAQAFFKVDLGCQRCVSKVTVRNSGNGIAANA